MKTIITNWKMNPDSLGEALELFDSYSAEIKKYENIQLIVCPPSIYLEEIAKKIKDANLVNLQLGAQDLFWENPPTGGGPFTGEVSADMLKNLDVKYALVGHSDRRYKIGEGDEIINKKVKAALDADITPVLLVGERYRARPSEAPAERGGDDDRRQVIETQLTADLAGLTIDQVNKALITYEPVWAISTNPDAQPDTPESTLEAMSEINKILDTRYEIQDTRFLYGGSVNQSNVADFLKHPEILGAVIGGASLRKEEFANILKIVDDIK